MKNIENLYQIGSVLDAEDLKIFPKNLIPEAPPGTEPKVIQTKIIICSTANIIVAIVLCKCKAE